ncbi:MAG: CDP-diacylglycerol--glycerol-3-phosphate 3-phosphatidyltransferase [Firmicutes bacterium]|nr:CDP-diacylglycerol--glycerol-3-phosphate 3-phosphatidyltransferase [Bacillota bacterium]
MNLANRITFLRILLIPVVVVALLLPLRGRAFDVGVLVGAILFIGAAVTDTVDGYVARSRTMVTNLGKFLDPLADKLLISMTLLALVDLQRAQTWAAMVIIAREFAVTGLRLVAAGEGRVIAAGSLGKAKTLMQVIAISFSCLSPLLDWQATALINRIGMDIAVVLTVLSGIDYFWKNWDVIRETGRHAKAEE